MTSKDLSASSYFLHLVFSIFFFFDVPIIDQPSYSNNNLLFIFRIFSRKISPIPSIQSRCLKEDHSTSELYEHVKFVSILIETFHQSTWSDLRLYTRRAFLFIIIINRIIYCSFLEQIISARTLISMKHFPRHRHAFIEHFIRKKILEKWFSLFPSFRSWIDLPSWKKKNQI
jgi:hypothetical protein